MGVALGLIALLRGPLGLYPLLAAVLAIVGVSPAEPRPCLRQYLDRRRGSPPQGAGSG